MLSGCGSGGGSDKNSSGSNGNPAGTSYIYGIASKGPIRQGFVVVYPLSPAGSSGIALGTTFTGDDGSYIVGTGTYNGNVLVEVKSGGTSQYTDEATNKVVKYDTILRAAVTRVNGSATVMVTPYTEIAVQMAMNDGGLTEANIDKANALTGTIAGGIDIINTRPANVLSADDISSSHSDEITYGLALASISEMVHDDAGSVPAAVSNISNDLDDGRLDTQGEKLSSALKAFLSNGNNQSGVPDISQTGIDEALLLASDLSFEKDSRDINQVFKILEDLYAVQTPSEDIRGWFDSNIAEDYLHDGRIKSDEADIWTGPGGLYQGVSLSAVLLSPMDITGTGFEKGYLIRVSFSGSNGTGSVVSSMVYDSDSGKWLWYGNHDWGVGLSNFLPRAEMVVEGNGQDVSCTNGFDMVIWDYNLSAYHHNIRSATITGPGLPADGLILEHYYPQSYFSLYNSSTGYRYPLTDDIVATIPDNTEYTYTINFYSESADQLSLSHLPAAVRTGTKTFTRRPYLSTELVPAVFPALAPDSHELASLNIGGQVNIHWTNPPDTSVNLASLSWIDANEDAQSVLAYPASGADTVAIDTADKPSADLTAQLYLRGEDKYGRALSLIWQYWRQAGPQEDVAAINDLFHTLEQIYAAPKTPADELTEMTAWFNEHVAADYLHDGRNRADDLTVWTGLGGLYEGISISAVLLDPVPDDNWGPYQTGYRVRLYFSGPVGSGSILSSIVYDGTKWLWYGNQEWGLGLSGFLPWAEKTISSTDITFDTGFEVIIWDSNLAAYNKGGIRSAIITGPGLPADGVKLKHYYSEANPEKTYLSLSDTTGGFSYSLSDEQINEITDNAVYNINFYTQPAETVNLSQYTPVKSLTRTIKKGPVLISDLEADHTSGSGLYFPELSSPVSHELADAQIPGSLQVNWDNPSLMFVNFVSLGWLDLTETGGMKYVSGDPQYNAGHETGHVTLTTQGSASLFANLFLRGEDLHNRRFSVTWQFSDTTLSTTTP